MAEQEIDTVVAERYAEMLYEPLNALLVSHGGRIEIQTTRWLYVFPPDTIREEKWPRVQSTRYTITFPDGFQLHQMVERSGKTLIFFYRKDIPEEIIKQYEQTEAAQDISLLNDERGEP